MAERRGSGPKGRGGENSRGARSGAAAQVRGKSGGTRMPGAGGSPREGAGAASGDAGGTEAGVSAHKGTPSIGPRGAKGAAKRALRSDGRAEKAAARGADGMPPPERAPSPRIAARRLIAGVIRDRRPLSEIEAGLLAPLPPEGRAEARRLAVGTLRHLARADAVLKPLLGHMPPPPVRAVLRMATVELMGGGAAHGVVDEAVRAVRKGPRAKAVAGLVNAVLRRVAAGGAPRWEAGGPNRLPPWIRGRVQGLFGARRTAMIERAHEGGAPLDLTPKDGDAAALAGRLRAAGQGAEALPTGSVRLLSGARLSALPGYDEGAWWVQDAAAALLVRMLGLKPGERALDLCAAPGGKAMQMIAAGADVTCVDSSAERMERLRANLARTGLNAEVVVADLLEWRPEAPADAILLDAPCTATGTIRRHPDLPIVRDGSGLKDIAALQAALLDRALGWLAPGGRLVVCTCSLLPEEGEQLVEAALVRHPGLRVERAVPEGAEADWHGPLGLRTAPDLWAERGGMDGFFAARLSFGRPDMA